MGSNWNKITGCAVCGLALCGHLWREAHEEAGYIKRPFAQKSMMEAMFSPRQPHGEEPEQPGGPLRMPQVTVTSTSTASVSAAPLIFGPTGIGNGLPHGLVWNPNSSALIWGGTTDQSSGTSFSATSTSTIVPFPQGTRGSS